ncbi:FtsQ-type POTRA domain-containing protein [Streptomyces sp. NPDC006458]|uniref:cell division protein FtsQ/DivIB n=1 Tax=Streptomyces sp. NPDC006458 TaxID=3154302 RepID=UPI0033AA2A59
MAGSTTAERGDRQQESSGPPPARRLARRRIRLAIAGTALVVLLSAGSVWLFYGSRWLRVERVTVSGTQVLAPRQVAEAAEVPVGDPLVSVDTAAIEARLRRELPRVDSVEAVRSWPNGISLKVVERTPVLLVENGGKFIEVDDEGVRFATVSKAPKDVPVLELTVSRSTSAAASLRRFDERRLTREAVRVARALPDAVARDARVVEVRSYDAISVELRGGRTVAWGSSEKGHAKARTLSALMKATPGARHFDVSVPTAPASSGS